MLLDTNLLLPVAVLLGSALLLVLLTAAEAASIHLARRRVTRDSTASLSSLLRDYVAQRQRLLRALRTGVTAATVYPLFTGVAAPAGKASRAVIAKLGTSSAFIMQPGRNTSDSKHPNPGRQGPILTT